MKEKRKAEASEQSHDFSLENEKKKEGIDACSSDPIPSKEYKSWKKN